MFFSSPRRRDWIWEPIQPSIKWLLGAVSPGVKWQGHEHLPPSSAKVKNGRANTSTAPHFFVY
jgi:hypothetical protein